MSSRYDGQHQSTRRRMLPYAVGSQCARCGNPILDGEPIDLDHADNGDGYLGWSHASCNRRAGGRASQLGRADRARVVSALSRVVVAAEVSWDRGRTSVGAAGRDGDVWRIELVDCVDGTDVVDELIGLRRLPGVAALVVDPVSPAAPVADALRRRKIKLVEPGLRDVATATGEFMDALRAGELRAADQPVLTAAVRHVGVRQTALGAAFDRRSEADASPLIAVTLALWGARRLPPARQRRVLLGDQVGERV